jgi:transposase-like protein
LEHTANWGIFGVNLISREKEKNMVLYFNVQCVECNLWMKESKESNLSQVARYTCTKCGKVVEVSLDIDAD